MSKRPIANVLILTAALMIGVGPYLVRAAGMRPAGELTASIDLQKVFAESDARETADHKIAEYGKMMGARFDEIASQQFLTPVEIKDYADALNVESPGATEKAKTAAIKSAASKRSEELQALSNKPEAQLTAADKARMKELNAMPAQSREVFTQLQRFFQNLVNAQDAKLTREALAEVRAVVAKLAKDQGIAQVYDTSCLVYTQIDLTTAATNKVAKKKSSKS